MRLLLATFLLVTLMPTVSVTASSNPTKRKVGTAKQKVKRKELETKSHNVYYFKQTSEHVHPGMAGYDCPQRLLAHKRGLNLKEQLTAELGVIPNIDPRAFRVVTRKKEERIIKFVKELFPDCPGLTELFETLQTCLLHPKGKPLYHSSDVSKEAPLFAGTHHALLNNVELIVENVTVMLKSPIKQRNFLLLRPPGHHACAALGGFCYINNVILAQRLILAKNPAAKIAIIDIDLHDGNGTRALLETNHSNTFMLNIYNGSIYPFSVIEPCNHVININLPIGTKHKEYYKALRAGLTRLKAKFGQEEPDYVLISAGFDTCKADSETRFSGQGFDLLSPNYESYYRAIARAFPASHISAYLEGGYDPKTLQASFAYAMKGLFAP